MSGDLMLCPVTLREARAFVAAHHRHHRPPQGGLFAIGLADRSRQVDGASVVVGVAIVGRPVARQIADGFTAEVTRLCTDGTANAPSMLLGSCWRAARALGYRRLVTYTLPEEGGASLRAAGWRLVAEQTKGGPWSRASRPRVDLHPQQPKLRWEAGEEITRVS